MSKPEGLQYSFYALADLTLHLLSAAGAERVTVVGHSMGGMLAMRLALLAPQRVEQLVLVGLIGLSDRGSYTPLPQLLANERKTSIDTIKAYELHTYYHGEWRPEYER